MVDKVEKILTLYSDVQATSVHWLWYPFIAVGKLTLLQGDPGDGKSTMMMNLIAELSKGGKTPDGKPVGMPQRIIYQCSEDGVSDSIGLELLALRYPILEHRPGWFLLLGVSTSLVLFSLYLPIL